MKAEPVIRQHRTTLDFLRHIRAFSPVFLDTDVDMSGVRAHRAAGRRYSTVTYALHAAAGVLARHPHANAHLAGGRRPKVMRYPAVSGKFAMDKTFGGQRVVMTAVLPGLDTASLDEIQDRVEHYRTGDPDTMPEYERVRRMQRLPGPLRAALFGVAARSLALRPSVFGTFAVSSLGHRAVDGFYSVGGTTITLGLGRIADRPVVRDGGLGIAPLMRMTLTFDHRVIDGAEAADVLTEIKAALEAYAAPAESPAVTQAVTETTAQPVGVGRE
ncbi:2-oxo acid dehydrogenase subunit E2 [Dactylosporangium sp. NPDC005572]|uniref:2-oxo acid dehydrogenase subunit E2 n=1 Tax=Dactylosporangium sp. NPDC005572 TaxID=3156889 RepID=UPI0033B6623A